MKELIKKLAAMGMMIEAATPPRVPREREPEPPRKADPFKKRKRKMTQVSRRRNR